MKLLLGLGLCMIVDLFLLNPRLEADLLRVRLLLYLFDGAGALGLNRPPRMLDTVLEKELF